MDINVRPSNLKKSPDVIDGLGKALRSYSETVSAIAKDPHLDDASKEIIAASLKKTSAKMLEAAAAADSFGTALRLIAKHYEDTEAALVAAAHSKKDVVASVTMASTAASASFWDKFKETEIFKHYRMMLVEHGLIKAEKQTRTEGVPVTKYQEREMDLYMQQQIAQLSKNDRRFTESYWRTASLAERKEILQDYIKEVCKIMGLPESEINWEYSPAETGSDGRTYTTMGYFSRTDSTIHINEWVLEHGDASGFSSYREFSTVTHELRHYYQHESVNHPDRYVVTNDTINSWDQSFRDYKTTEGFMRDGMNQTDAYQAYRNQTIEVDARHFAGQD